MNNNDLFKSAGGFLTTNAVIGSAASELADLNRQQAAKIAGIALFYSHYLSDKQLADKIGNYILSGNLMVAFEFLNESLKKEIIHDSMNQKEFKTHLSVLINERREKYRPFYEKIAMKMPSYIAEMTAEEICLIMGVKLMTAEELKQYHSRKDDEERFRRFTENLGLAFRIVLITGLVILLTYL